MSTVFTSQSNRQVFLALSMSIVLFIFSACSAYAADAEKIIKMENQLNSAAVALSSLITQFVPQGVVLGASTSQVETEMQAKIKMLMEKIALLQQGKSETGAAKKPDGTSVQPLSAQFFKLIQTTKKIDIGQQDTPVGKVMIAKSTETRYLNEVKLRVVPTKKNNNALPWESFEEMSAWVGGKKVLTTGVSDQNSWKLITGPEGKKMYELVLFKGNQQIPANVSLKATLAISSSDQANAKDMWTFFVPKNGVTVWTEKAQHQKYGPSRAFTFAMVGDEENEVEEEGAVLGATLSLPEAELVVLTSSENPDATTFAVERSAKSDPVGIFTFTLDSDDSRVNVEVEQIGVHVATSDKGGASDVIARACLLVKGTKFCDTVVEKTTTDTIYWFNIGGATDFVITPAERVDVVFEAAFKPLARNYAEGTTIVASVKASEMSVDYGTTGELSGSQLLGAATGETHTLYTEGLLLHLTSTQETLDVNSDTTVNDDEGIFRLEFEATAFETDVYIPATVARGVKNTAAGVNYKITNGTGATTSAGIATATLTSTADLEGSYYVVHEGETEVFTVTVSFNPKTTGAYGVGLLKLNWNNMAATPDMKALFRTIEDFESDLLSI